MAVSFIRSVVQKRFWIVLLSTPVRQFDFGGTGLVMRLWPSSCMTVNHPRIWQHFRRFFLKRELTG